MTLLIIYWVGIVLLPIITIGLVEIFPGSMEVDDDSFADMVMVTSFFWPVGIFVVGHSILKYWHKH